MSFLTDTWDRLSTHGEVGEGYVRLRLAEVGECAAYAARRVADGLEAVVIEVETGAIPGDVDYPASTGVDVTATILEPGRTGRTRLLLSLRDERFRDIFRWLAEDIIGGIGAAQSESEVVRSFVSRLTRWQAFLRKHGASGLSLEARRGLYGELHFLKTHLLQQVDHLTAVRAWKGCRGANHDYQLPRGNVEVKTTSANTPHAFHVSSIRQLDDRGVDALFVYFVVLDEVSGGGESLVEQVDAIRQVVRDDSREAFDECLIEAGFLDMQRDQYTSPTYRLRSARFFRVVDGFPRILEDGLSTGVEDVTYTVAIAACTGFEWGADRTMNQLTDE